MLYRVLDLSWNRIPKIEGLEALTKLKKLFLIQNKITKMENLNHLVDLEMLELGANRIRVSTCKSIITVYTKINLNSLNMKFRIIRVYMLVPTLFLDSMLSLLQNFTRQPIIANAPAGGEVFKHVRCSDWSYGTCIQVEESDVIWLLNIELYVDLGK